MDIYDEDYFSIKPDNFLIGIEKDSTKVSGSTIVLYLSIYDEQWSLKKLRFSFIEKTWSQERKLVNVNYR
jgi:hypothetical protein